MKRYEFDQFGNCTNPDVVGSTDNGNTCILVAHSNVSGWVYGFRYKTRTDAVVAGIRALNNVIALHSVVGDAYAPIRQCVNKAYEEVKQTTLDLQ